MTAGLYQQILGKDWLALAENVRLAHCPGREMRGTFRITHGNGWLARRLARQLRLPEPAPAADTRLTIFADDSGERWLRQFNGQKMETRQWQGRSSQLVELLGEWELDFTLHVKDGSLHYQQSGARLCLGALRIPLPRFCTPNVVGKEVSDGATRVLVSVQVNLPFIGPLISYEGYLNPKSEIENRQLAQDLGPKTI